MMILLENSMDFIEMDKKRDFTSHISKLTLNIMFIEEDSLTYSLLLVGKFYNFQVPILGIMFSV